VDPVFPTGIEVSHAKESIQINEEEEEAADEQEPDEILNENLDQEHEVLDVLEVNILVLDHPMVNVFPLEIEEADLMDDAALQAVQAEQENEDNP